jgi:hypothetical protein
MKLVQLILDIENIDDLTVTIKVKVKKINLNIAILAQQNIRSFNVSVDLSLIMQIFNSMKQIACDTSD